MRGASEVGEDSLPDLFRVGWEKPMGYMPLYQIREKGFAPHQVMCDLRAERTGRVVRWFAEDECTVWTGALFVYHHEALVALLGRNADLLNWAGWPTKPGPFVTSVVCVAAMDDEVALVIAEGFADERLEDVDSFPTAREVRGWGDRPRPVWSGRGVGCGTPPPPVE